MVAPYKHCFYDKHTSTIFLRTEDDLEFRKIKYKKDYYVKDPTGKSNILDIYGTPMIKKTNYDKDVIANLKKAKLEIAESDLKEEVKYMHDLYDNEDLAVNLDKWNICLFDIEVANTGMYKDDHKIKVRKDNVEKETTIYILRNKLSTMEGLEIYDEEKQDWKTFKESCYVSIEGFPYSEKAEVPINLITCYSSKTKQTYTWGLGYYTGNNPIVTNYRGFKTELELLKDWLKWFKDQHFDIWSGWNSNLFDVPYIVNRVKNVCQFNNIKTAYENLLSPVGKAPIETVVGTRDGSVTFGTTYNIPGLLHHDYMDLYDKMAKHPPLASLSLNYITKLELGEGKLDYDGSINDTYKFDWNTFVEYNVQDVLLLVKLELKIKLFSMIIEYAYDCITTVDKILNKVPTTEGFILKFLHKQNKVLNDRKEKHVDWWRNEKCYLTKDKNGNTYYQNTETESKDFLKYQLKLRYVNGETEGQIIDDILKLYKDLKSFSEELSEELKANNGQIHPFKEFGIKAGYCYDYPGRFDNCMSFDITSSYPHHIMQFNISPEVKVIHPTKEQIDSGEVIPSDINEVGFKRTTDAILPSLVKMVFDQRAEFKRLMKNAHKEHNDELENLFDTRQNIKKLTINSMYGVCLTPTFHLYDLDCARSITRCARVTLRDWLSKNVNDYYVSKFFIKDLEKQMKTVTLTVGSKSYTYLDNEMITVQRDGQEIQITASEFNKETDLLGVNDED